VNSIDLSEASIERLCRVYGELLWLREAGKSHVTSGALARAVGATGASLRRDINGLGVLGPSRSGYRVEQLVLLIGSRLGLKESQRVCVIGLDGVGEALVRVGSTGPFEIAAGFDWRINRLETMEARVPLFSVYDLETVLGERDIPLAIIAAGDPTSFLPGLERAGVRGVLNMTKRYVDDGEFRLVVINMAIIDQLRRLTALIMLGKGGH
jgi:redox-sensing transcriptional repressor